MSLCGSRKFWKTKMQWRSRCSYLSGFCYYMHTAVMTFVAPMIPLTLMLAFPEMVLLENYLLIVPSLVYTLVVFPIWHRNQFGLSALAVKMIYGWAHVFSIADIVLSKQKAWQPTGNNGSTKGVLDRHFSVGIFAWSGMTGATWVGVAVWHVLSGDWKDFGPVTLSGLLYLAIVIQSLSPTTASKEKEAAAEEVPAQV